MTPKEKTIELIDKCITFTDDYYIAKQCALIVVDEIINTLTNLWGGIKEVVYWTEVKLEIEKL